MPLPRVSIIVVSWNALPLLERCFPSVVATTYPDLEIILADNASDDGSSAWVEARYPQVHIIRHKENYLFCKGNNDAVAQATGKYVALLNNDVETPPEWLTPLVAAAERDPLIAAVQPKLLQFDARDHFEYAGAAGGYLDRLGYPFARGRVLGRLEKDEGQYDAAREVDWASGAALLLRRAALDDVGPLDERFELHMEEIDLCWRLRRSGYKVLAEPRSHVFHVGGGSLAAESTRKLYYNFRNNLLMLYKNLPPQDWRRIFAQRVLIDGAAMAAAFLSGRWRTTFAIARAYRDAHRLRPSYADDRPARGDAVAPPSYAGSIIFDYFLWGRRSFDALPAERFRS